MGGLAFVAGFITFKLLLDENALKHHFMDFLPVSTSDWVGLHYFSGHFVQISGFREEGLSEGNFTANLISEGFYQYPDFVYYLVPIVALTAAGYLLLEQGGCLNHVRTDKEAAKYGATVVVGYFPLVVVGNNMFSVSGQRWVDGVRYTLEASPESGTALLLAGIIYPVVFGGLGGYIAFSRA